MKLLEQADRVNEAIARFRDKNPDGLTFAEYRLLLCLRDEPITLKQIAEQRNLSQQACGKLLKGVVERGFADKKVYRNTRIAPKGTDRREASVSITRNGKRAVTRANKMVANL